MQHFDAEKEYLEKAGMIFLQPVYSFMRFVARKYWLKEIFIQLKARFARNKICLSRRGC